MRGDDLRARPGGVLHRPHAQHGDVPAAAGAAEARHTAAAGRNGRVVLAQLGARAVHASGVPGGAGRALCGREPARHPPAHPDGGCDAREPRVGAGRLSAAAAGAVPPAGHQARGGCRGWAAALPAAAVAEWASHPGAHLVWALLQRGRHPRLPAFRLCAAARRAAAVLLGPREPAPGRPHGQHPEPAQLQRHPAHRAAHCGAQPPEEQGHTRRDAGLDAARNLQQRGACQDADRLPGGRHPRVLLQPLRGAAQAVRPLRGPRVGQGLAAAGCGVREHGRRPRGL
mmetsp:Transcript_4834/g.12111  ORF Transcript_4834/g.12111 Transcript_4834/m.12111 type:complete len:285 (-) Transcript_4834:1723-2577(-)